MDLAFISEEEFDSNYPVKIQQVSRTHWTPIAVTKKAMVFLGEEGKTILDIGSGSGKFCIMAGACSDSHVVGVELKENLVKLSKKLAIEFELYRVRFIHGDIQELDFSPFDHFYFFNSFEEHVNPKDQLDKGFILDPDYHKRLIQGLNLKFDAAPIGTRIVTYCGDCQEIPASYSLVKSSIKGKLKFWIKRD